MTVSEDCLNGRNVRAVYELSYTTYCGTLITTCVVDGTECSNGACRHELQENTADSRCQPQVSQFSGEDVTVSVTARNIVGRSNSAVSRSIGEFSVDQHDLSVLQLVWFYNYAVTSQVPQTFLESTLTLLIQAMSLWIAQ